MAPYPHLFSEWQIRNTTIKNRVVFPPTCPSFVSDPWDALFTDMATAYYRERAQGGVGLIIIGATHVHKSSIMAPLLMPQLFDDRQIEPLSRIAEACHEEGCKLAIQLWHSRIRGGIGDEMFLGYRINSTSFWPGDLELDDVKEIVPDLERQTDIDYVDVSAGVHHAYIHTPMEFEPGWEKGYAHEIRDVSSKPVLLVGRITTPEVAENLLAEGHADAICLARQLFTDPAWAVKAQEGREEDIRRRVAAKFCWESVSRGGRVQCVYNPEIGREGTWGALTTVADPKRVLVVGGGPAGLEFARVAAARGHGVVVLEAEEQAGGHVRLQSLLPSRGEYGLIGEWLADQGPKKGGGNPPFSPPPTQ